MTHIKYYFTLLIILLPFVTSAFEPIFKLKDQTIMLASSPSTLGVVYDAEALTKNDFAKKYLSATDFAGKVITVTKVNVINWDKKNQGLIVEFNYENHKYCFYFPQNIHTSDITKHKPFSRFYTGSYLDMYQTRDDNHFVKPKTFASPIGFVRT